MSTVHIAVTAGFLVVLATTGLALWWLPHRQSRSMAALRGDGDSSAAHPGHPGVRLDTDNGDGAGFPEDSAGNGGIGGHRESPSTALPPVSAGVLVELVASMLDAGVPVNRSLTVLGRTVDGPAGHALSAVGTGLTLGLPWRQAWAAAGPLPIAVQDLRSALTFSAVSGAPSSSALRAASAQVRRAEHRRAEAAAERLAVHLVVPLGLCSLPAFIAWGIVPVLIGLVPDFFG